jgi:diphosphate-dependent phosphofructokinase
LIIHEVMGRNCGWLTAATAESYRRDFKTWEFLLEVLLDPVRWDVHAIWIPEMDIDMDAECERLMKVMDEHDCVNVFLSEGAGADAIVRELEASGQAVPRDAFGHVRLDEINVGNWFSKQLKQRLNAEKVLVQKSGYFARSAAPNGRDLELIKRCCELAADAALRGESGVTGEDEDRDGALRVIEFPRIKGGKPFDITAPWFTAMLAEIGQPVGRAVTAAH